MIFNKIVLIVVFNLFYFHFFAQVNESVNNVIDFGNYKGVEKYNLLIKDSLKSRSGKYFFESELASTLKNDTINFSKLKINGNYRQNFKDGIWGFNFNVFKLIDVNIKSANNPTLQYKLTELEDVANLNYKSGFFNGLSTIKQNVIKNRKRIPALNKVSINYRNDTIVGDFNLTFHNVILKGQTNSMGFLEGILELKYANGDTSFVEKRIYKNGFLIELEKRNERTNTLLVHVIYNEVVDKLDMIKRKSPNVNYEVSEEYFGLNFNIGYKSNDIKLLAQTDGNKIIEKHLYVFDSIHNVYTTDAKKQSIIKFTRKFIYPNNESDYLFTQQLLSECQSLRFKIDSFINKPNILLRKSLSNELSQKYATLKHIKTKNDTLIDVLELNLSEYFRFRSRNQYYNNGIPGTSQNDYVNYLYKNQPLSFVLQFNNNKIDSLSFFYKIKNIVNILQEKADNEINNIKSDLKIFENNEIIDSLENDIAFAESRLNKRFSALINNNSIDVSKTTFAEKFFISVMDRNVDVLKKKYFSSGASQEEMIIVGTDLLCYLRFLDLNTPFLDTIQNLNDYWNSTFFTIYRDNPFDFRKLETKILDGVQASSEKLLRHYANLLLNTKGCAQMEYDLNKIKKLDERVKFLVKNQQLDKVQQLNKALRREQVPARIERLLEL